MGKQKENVAVRPVSRSKTPEILLARKLASTLLEAAFKNRRPALKVERPNHRTANNSAIPIGSAETVLSPRMWRWQFTQLMVIWNHAREAASTF